MAGELVTENGLPAVKFDGVNDLLEQPDVQFADAATVALVAKTDNDTTSSFFFDGDESNKRIALFEKDNADGISMFSRSEAEGGSTTASGFKNTSLNLMYAVYDDDQSDLHVNGIDYIENKRRRRPGGGRHGNW